MPTAVGDIAVTSPMAAKVAEASGSSRRRDAVKVVFRTLVRQLPPHDFDQRHCGSLQGQEERATMEEFVETRIRSSLGKGLVAQCPFGSDVTTSCHECLKPVLPGHRTVTATRATAHVAAGSPSSAPVWHQECFVCWQCREQLVEQIYFWSADGARIYCGRHHAETLRPRCASCDEIIFADECTEADGQFWHVDHFRCVECEHPLAGRRYVIANEKDDIGGQPYCFRCYHAVLANFCRTCGQIIKAGQRHVALKGTGCWHAEKDCFRCDFCRQPLIGQPFVMRDCPSNTGTTISSELFCSEVCSFRRLQNEVIDTRKNEHSMDGSSVCNDDTDMMAKSTPEVMQFSSSSSTGEDPMTMHVDSDLLRAYLGRSPLARTYRRPSKGGMGKHRSYTKRRQDELVESCVNDGDNSDVDGLFGERNEKISKCEKYFSSRSVATDQFILASRVTSV